MKGRVSALRCIRAPVLVWTEPLFTSGQLRHVIKVNKLN